MIIQHIRHKHIDISLITCCHWIGTCTSLGLGIHQVKVGSDSHLSHWLSFFVWLQKGSSEKIIITISSGALAMLAILSELPLIWLFWSIFSICKQYLGVSSSGPWTFYILFPGRLKNQDNQLGDGYIFSWPECACCSGNTAGTFAITSVLQKTVAKSQLWFSNHSKQVQRQLRTGTLLRNQARITFLEQHCYNTW